MADYEVKKTPEFTATTRKLETTDRAHADLFNDLYQKLFDNDNYLKENKMDSTNGDIADTQVSEFAESSEALPVPMAGDKVKNLWGKMKKWQQDCLAKFGNYVLTSMITNQHLNDTNRIPTSALVYLMQQSITQLNSDFGMFSDNLGIVTLGESLSGVSFENGVSKKTGEIHLPAGIHLVFATYNLDKNKVAAGTIADIVIGTSHGVNASLSRASEENIVTVRWDTKSLVGLHVSNGATVIELSAAIYGGNLQVDALQCRNIYAVRLR